MKKLEFILPATLLFLAATSQLHAQISGCTDSPENPTAVLALVSAAGICCAHLRDRFRARNK